MSESALTSISLIRIVSPHLIEQHFHEGATVDREGLREAREAREQLCGQRPYAVLIFIPKDVHFDAMTSDVDHFNDPGTNTAPNTITALALVAHDDMVEVVSKVYFTFHPQDFKVKVFNNETKARTWLSEQLPTTGSGK